jgi:hypothetical protein
MRVTTGSTDRQLYFVAVDDTDRLTRLLGLTSFTVYRSRNGGAAVAYTSPTITQISAINMPGVYCLLIDEDTTLDAGHDEEEITVHITHAGMAPVTRSFELCRPKGTEGRALALTAGGSVEPLETDVANVDSVAAGIAATANLILGDTDELQTDWANGGRLDVLLDAASAGGDPGVIAAAVGVELAATPVPSAEVLGNVQGSVLGSVAGSVGTVLDQADAMTGGAAID